MINKFSRFWTAVLAKPGLILGLGLGAIALITWAIPPSPALSNSSPQQMLHQGQVQYQAGQVDQAIGLWQQALHLYRQAQNTEGEVVALEFLGSAYTHQERYPLAIQVLEALQPLVQANPTVLARTLGNLGLAYRAMGRYRPAIEVQRQAGKLWHQLQDRQGLGQLLGNLGNALEAVGDYDQARHAYQQSQKLARQVGDREGERVALNNLGAVYVNLDQTEQAIQAFQTSLTLSQALQNISGQASALINLGTAYQAKKDRDRAITSYQQALDLAKTAGNLRQQAEAYGNLGIVYEDQQDFEQAIAAYRRSVAIAEQLASPSHLGVALNNLGHGLFNAGQLPEAEAVLRQAVQILDRLRPGLSDRYQVSIFDTQRHTYSLLQQILIKANRPDAALAASEWGRARAFAELLAKRQRSHPTASQAAADASSPSLPPISVADMKRVAQEQQATLVEYAIVPDDDFKFRGKQRARAEKLLIWVVQPSGQITARSVDLRPLWQKKMDLPDLVVASRCFALIDDCLDWEQRLPAIAPASQGTSYVGLRLLHHYLIEPIADLLPQDPTAPVILVPQDQLFLVPFAALQGPDGKFLIERHTLQIAPALQVLALTHSHRTVAPGTPQSQALIIGNPTMPSVSLALGEPPHPLPALPGAEAEASAIAQLLGTQPILGGAATKERIRQDATQAKLIHFATHGLLEYGTEDSSMSGLGMPGAVALTPTSTDSGLLTSDEILDWSLQADLVVLSACDTGRGRITGDGVIGLSRAFISAGVPSLVVSLWAVNDESTAELMQAFYRQWLKQPNQAQALRQAILTTMQNYPSPQDWAAFILIGHS